MLLFIIVTLVLIGLACATTTNGGDDDDDDDDSGDDDVAEETTVYDIQQENVEPGTRVTLTNVVVSSPLTDKGDGFFVMEPEGGAYSGIYIFITGEASGEISPTVGDVVTLSGIYDEYFEFSEITLAAVGDYEVVDFAGAPTPEDVAPADLASTSTQAEQWEGVLVRIASVTVTEELNQFNEFTVTGPVVIDDLFWPNDQAPDPPEGTAFDALIGPVSFSFEAYKVCPRFVDDFDGDWQPDPVGDDDDDAVDATIYEVQQGDYEPGDVVTVSGVITSPLNFKGDTFWIQDPLGGAYSGIAIYMWDEVETVYDGQAGDEVTVTGEVAEYYDLTELVVKDPGDLDITGSTDVPEPEQVSLDELGEPWESVLVKVVNINATTNPDQYGEFTVSDGDESLVVDDLFFEIDHWINYPIGMGDTFNWLQGVLYYSYEVFKLEPRWDSDVSKL